MLSFKEYRLLIENNPTVPTQPQTGSTPPPTINMQSTVKGVKADRQNLGREGWVALQKLYDLLKALADKNPQKLLQIVNRIRNIPEIKDDPEVSPLLNNIVAGTRKIISNVGD